ncbi:uncharacterized protein I206_101806 [Kwoniella pini CBS 10737]|uniref:Uncharacterized protein n=1 Tax=Kwoniella pini CBS 10737 TaxID=1296096 RepID=A0A1B9HVN0_9TREE|nr:uncharacterized protein I206_06221 [Kwoniella pini CBS 10737]OCF47326.1 hypothetical protein I206_06221 [Kwoniella pini CBS 10737]
MMGKKDRLKALFARTANTQDESLSYARSPNVDPTTSDNRIPIPLLPLQHTAKPSPKIPIEIILKIVEYCSDSLDCLTKLALTNHEISNLALKLIWYNLELGKSSKHPFHLTISNKINKIKFNNSSSLSKIPSRNELQNLTKIINCYFENYNYLLRFSSNKNQFKNLKILKIHLNSLKGLPNKKGNSIRKENSEDILSKNYAKKLPLNFKKIIFIGLPDPYYSNNWYANWNEKGFKPYFNQDDDDKQQNIKKIKMKLSGPKKIVFQLNDKYTDKLINHIENIFNEAKFPNLIQLDIIFLPKSIKKGFQIKQEFQLFVNQLIQMLIQMKKGYPKMRIRLINIGSLDSRWMGISSNNNYLLFSTPINLTNESIEPIFIENQEELEERKMLWLKDYLQKQARAKNQKILDDAGFSIIKKDEEGKEVEKKIYNQEMISLKQYKLEEEIESD